MNPTPPKNKSSHKINFHGWTPYGVQEFFAFDVETPISTVLDACLKRSCVTAISQNGTVFRYLGGSWKSKISTSLESVKDLAPFL